MNNNDYDYNSIANKATNAKQARELSKIQEQIIQGKNIKQQAAKAQIESQKTLEAQFKEIESLKQTVSDLLRFNHEQSIALKAKEEIEDRRYESTARLSKIATWTSVFSMIIAVVATLIQIASTFKFL
jgi:hypothetical protein